MTRLAEYTKTYYPIFLFGAVFARLMEKGGLASSVAAKIVEVLGEKRAVLAVLLGCGALTYGGLSVFVVAFVMYPFGAVVFRKADIPKRLLPATLCRHLLFCHGIPARNAADPEHHPVFVLFDKYLVGTHHRSFCFLPFPAHRLGMGYAPRKQAQGSRGRIWPSCRRWACQAKAEDSHSLVLVPVAAGHGHCHQYHPVKSIPLDLGIPLAEDALETFLPLNLSLMAVNVGKVSAIWSISVALVISSFAAAFIGRKRFIVMDGFLAPINYAAISSATAVLNVASGYAFGCVITSLPGFVPVTQMLIGIADSFGPLLSAVITTNIMAGITGSASGGLTIALSMLGEQWAYMSQNAGIPLEVLHRITAIASVGIDRFLTAVRS